MGKYTNGNRTLPTRFSNRNFSVPFVQDGFFMLMVNNRDVVTSRQITKAGKVIGIESLRETIKVNDPKSFVLHILNQFVYHYDTMYVQIINM